MGLNTLIAYLSVVAGLAVVAAGLYHLHPALMVLPGLGLVTFGLVGVNVDGG